MNVGDDSCHADPGIQALFAEKQVAEQIEPKADNYEQNSPQQIKQASLTPPSFGYAGWLRTAAFRFGQAETIKPSYKERITALYEQKITLPQSKLTCYEILNFHEKP
ncbi:hypothetical protein AMQ83_01810 [Paenibacillus riograndensis]|nr:hypothetical protein AMQ83_01810 [Paenibacillus riograndensis]